MPGRGEALLRIPDDFNIDALIADKIPAADWQQHIGQSDSLFVNASTWGLVLTGRVVFYGLDSGRGVFTKSVAESTITMSRPQTSGILFSDIETGASSCEL